MRNVSNHQAASTFSKGPEMDKANNVQVVRQSQIERSLKKQTSGLATARKRTLRRRDTLADLQTTTHSNVNSTYSNPSAQRSNSSENSSPGQMPAGNAKIPAMSSPSVSSSIKVVNSTSQGHQSYGNQQGLRSRRPGNMPRLSYVKPESDSADRCVVPAAGPRANTLSIQSSSHTSTGRCEYRPQLESEPSASVCTPPTKSIQQDAFISVPASAQRPTLSTM